MSLSTIRDEIKQINVRLSENIGRVELPRESIKVYGGCCVYVRVQCVGICTAKKWKSMLALISGNTPKIVKTSWEDKNSGTSLKPKMVIGYIVSVNIG